MDSLCLLINGLIVISFSLCVVTSCPRDQCGVVRGIFSKDLLPIFTEFNLEVPELCPLLESRDKYSAQESQKHEDSPSRWICNFCGKQFYDERYLDLHFENRHAEFVRTGDNIVCLADYCDIFRCDIVSGRKKPSYWDKAMCRESDVKIIKAKCQELMTVCVPPSLTEALSKEIQDALESKICKFLTCKDIWEVPDGEVDAVNTVLYLVFSILLAFALMVYYYVAYTHFYTGESLIIMDPHPSSYNQHLRQGQEGTEIRNRIASASYR